MNSKEILSKISQNLEKIALHRNELKASISEKNQEIEALKSKVESLQNQVEATPSEANNQLKSTIDTSKNKEVKLKIDGLIEEIDECLVLLNN